MEYFREPKNRIQAGFALNAGKLLFQYQRYAETLSPASRFEATLTICVLQSMLTNCEELLNSMGHAQKLDWAEPLTDIPHRWGLKRDFVIRDTYPVQLTPERFMSHLRDSMSHPTSPDRSPELPSTGYTTITNSTGLITAFRFTNSPWIDRGRYFSHYANKKEETVLEKIASFEKKYNFRLEVSRNENGLFQPMHDGQPYLPVFISEIPVSGLIRIATELSNYLAQPTQEHWNGKTVKQLVAG